MNDFETISDDSGVPIVSDGSSSRVEVVIGVVSEIKDPVQRLISIGKAREGLSRIYAQTLAEQSRERFKEDN